MLKPNVAGRGLQDDLGGDLAGPLVGQDVGEDHLGQLDGERLVVEAGEGRDPDEGAFELADVVLDVGGDELEHLVGDVGLLALGLLAQDGQAGLELGGLDVGDEAPLEAAAEAVLEGGDRAGVAVRRQHDLLVGLVERVEGVEELLLEAFLALHELDVVDEEDVARPGSGA